VSEARRDRKARLAVLASHPIQYFTPIYKRLARHPEIDLEVMFCRDYGVRPRFDKQFGQSIQWDTDQLGGYEHRFLVNLSPIHDPFNPLHAINPGAFTRLLAGFDALWVNGYLYPSNWLAVAAARLRGTKVLVRSELDLVDQSLGQRAAPLRRMRDAVLGRWIRHADALLYIGERNRQAYLAHGARQDRLYFTPYSVDVENITPATEQTPADRAALRKAWNVPPAATVILFVAKLIEKKRPIAMIEIADALRMDPTVHVLIVGSGPQEVQLREEISRRSLVNVTMTGFVNQSRLGELYALSDIFVLPSHHEPWGLVVNEALCAGLPVVATNTVGSVADLISEGVTGFTFSNGDWPTLITRVRSLAGDSNLRARMGAGARARARSYSYDAAAEGVVAALRGTGALPPAASAG
jgi:glycosyltransferase involved in cell wall biosynthesis